MVRYCITVRFPLEGLGRKFAPLVSSPVEEDEWVPEFWYNYHKSKREGSLVECVSLLNA